MIKDCLIIGGAGFIGRNITESLLKNNFSVKVIDRNAQNIFSLQSKFPSLEIIKMNTEDTNKLIYELGNIESVIWLTHTSVPSTSMNNIELDFVSNVIPLIKFLSEITKRENIKKFIYFSSGGTVYGNPLIQVPIKENQIKAPISNYGQTKLVAEEYINFILTNSAIQHFILRPSNVYGLSPNLNKSQGIIGHAFNAILKNQPIVLFGNNIVTRDFIFVSDVSNSVIKCLEYNGSHNISNVFNVSSNKGYTINQVLNMIQELSGKELKIIEKPARSFDCNYNVLDSSLISSELGWSPKISFEVGLLKVWDWMKNYL